ncbi:MAG: hypothetical protein PHY02_00685 [Phycisphaerae bacterium]|nr:hypothetical protein [Phycisphaerae bacterium]
MVKIIQVGGASPAIRMRLLRSFDAAQDRSARNDPEAGFGAKR